jgi:hypothetical protein
MLRGVPYIGILIVNAIPLVGVLYFGWSVFEVLLLYWFENVAIGITHAVRMAISTRTNKAADGWGTTVFFCLHYGMFTLVHGVFVVTFFGIAAGGFRELTNDLRGPILAIVGWQIVYLLLDAMRTAGFKGRTPNDLLFEPYPRVLALHITVLAGAWAIDEMGSPVWALAILVAIKTFFDLGGTWLTSPPEGNPMRVFGALRKPRD